jgi:hypothetical protein
MDQRVQGPDLVKAGALRLGLCYGLFVITDSAKKVSEKFNRIISEVFAVCLKLEQSLF